MHVHVYQDAPDGRIVLNAGKQLQLASATTLHDVNLKHQLLGVARFATQTQEAVFQPTTGEIVLELMTHLLRQRLPLFFQRTDKAWVTLFDQLI